MVHHEKLQKIFHTLFGFPGNFNLIIDRKKTKLLNVRPSLRYRHCAMLIRPGSKIEVKIINLVASILFLLVGITFL